MKFAIMEKLHEKYVEDVVKEISQDNLWRKKLSAVQYDEPFLLTFKELDILPCSLWNIFSKYGLEFLVSKIRSCPEDLEDGTAIIKFEAKGFSHIVSYSNKIDIAAIELEKT